MKNKAAVIEKPGVIGVREVPMPEPGEYGALCKMLYGVTCTGTDTHLLHGRIPWRVDYPTVPGHESVGQVLETGPKVRYLKPGDIVTRVGLQEPDCEKAGLHWNWGGFCSYGAAMDFKAMRDDGYSDAQLGHYRYNHVIPPELDPRAATMVVTWRETLSYATRMGVSPGASVLVLGSGGVGLSYINVVKAMGASPVAAVGAKQRENAARKAGADYYADYRDPDMDKAFASRGEFDFIIDAVAAPDGLGKVLRYLKPDGVCGIYGLETGTERVLIAPGASRGFRFYAGGYDEEEANEKIAGMVKAGALDATVSLDLDCPYELDDIAAAYEDMQNRKCIKALIKL